MGIRTASSSERTVARLGTRLLDAAGEAIVAINPAGDVTYANAAAKHMYGWTNGVEPTNPVGAAAVQEDSAPQARDLMAQVRDGDEWSGRIGLQRPDGSRFRVQATATPVVHDGRLTDILIAASDVSEREHAEERFAQNNALLQGAQRLTHVGHWRWHIGSDHLEWLSDELYAIHGVSRDWVGTFDEYLKLVPNEDHPVVSAAGEEVLRAGSADVVHRIVRPDGMIRHVRNRSEAVYQADGTPVLVFGTCQDVTDLITVSAALEERIKELTCLVTVGQVLHDLEDPAWVYGCVGAGLVLAMEHPERAIAVLEIDGQQHSSAVACGPHDTAHLISAPILIRGREHGRIHVGYSDGGDDFLPEERDLLVAVASMLALWVERRESADALAATESRFRRLLDNVPDVVFRFCTDPDAGFDYVSPSVELLTGYRAEEFLADPRLIYRLLVPPDEIVASEAPEADDVTNGLAEVLRRDGSQRWVEYNIVSVVDDAGGLTAIEGVARDVTNRVVATQASQARGREQAALACITEAAVTSPHLDSLFDMAARMVVETLSVQASSVMELIANGTQLHLRNGDGWPDGVVDVSTFTADGSFAEETLGSAAATVLTDLCDGTVSAAFLSAHGFVSGVAVAIRTKGGTFGALGAFSTTAGTYSSHDIDFMQTIAHILGSAVDRWEAFAALASGEREFRTLAESLSDIVRRIDRNYRHIYANPAVERRGMSQSDVIGRTLNEVGLPADVVRVLERGADEVFATGRKISVEFALDEPEGIQYMQAIMTPEFDADGTVVTVISVARDITAVLRAEEVRRESLSRIVTAQEAERGRIGEDIHDDSIQVMAAVGMRLEGLRRHIDDPETMLMLGRLEDVVGQSVNRLRALMFELRPPELDREGLASALRLYLQATDADGGARCDVVDDWPAELAVEARNVLYRIALEAITNARKHGRPSHIEVRLEPAEGGLRMTVRDDGAGFEVAMLADVGPHHVGTTTMRERAEAAGGTLAIHSAVRAGTVVTAWLPVSAELSMDAA